MCAVRWPDRVYPRRYANTLPRLRFRRGLRNRVPWSLSWTSCAAELKFRIDHSMTRTAVQPRGYRPKSSGTITKEISTPNTSSALRPSLMRWTERRSSRLIAPDCSASRAERGAPTVISSRPGTWLASVTSISFRSSDGFHAEDASGEQTDAPADPPLRSQHEPIVADSEEAVPHHDVQPVLHQHLDTADGLHLVKGQTLLGSARQLDQQSYGDGPVGVRVAEARGQEQEHVHPKAVQERQPPIHAHEARRKHAQIGGS